MLILESRMTSFPPGQRGLETVMQLTLFFPFLPFTVPSPGWTTLKPPTPHFLSTLRSLVLPEISVSIFWCPAVLVFSIIWGQGPYLKCLCLFLSTGHMPCSHRCLMGNGSVNKWEQRALGHPVSFPTLFSSYRKKNSTGIISVLC